jgi:predicted small integral membrane protein
VGGEWFAMWQSTKWNGEEPALRNCTLSGVALAVVLIVGNDEKRPIDPY